jgi:hypothetical protein
MNKTKDSLVGFKLASINTIFHASYFLGLLLVKKEETPDDCSSFDTVKHLLFWVHLLGGLYQMVSYFLS